MSYKINDQVFCLRGLDGEPEWRIVINGRIIAASWRDKGAAEAGFEVEKRRAIAHQLKLKGWIKDK